MLGPLQMVPRVLPSQLPPPREARMSWHVIADSTTPQGTNSGSLLGDGYKKEKEIGRSCKL